ncbi:unnamed protein product [Closterium sp. NIES-53]
MHITPCCPAHRALLQPARRSLLQPARRALLPCASRPAAASAPCPTAASASRPAALRVAPCCSQHVAYCSQRVTPCCPVRRALLQPARRALLQPSRRALLQPARRALLLCASRPAAASASRSAAPRVAPCCPAQRARPAANTAAAAARATAAAGGGAAGSAGSAAGAGGAGGATGSAGGAAGGGGATGSAGGAAGPGGGGGFGFLRTAQRRQQSQQETFSPQVLSELFPQRCVTGSVEAAALGASESAAALGASESATSLGASESATDLGACASPATNPSLAEALHTFTLDPGASRCFFCDCTTLTPLTAPVPVSLADPTGGPVVARASTVLPCPAVPSASLSGLHLPTFSTNMHSHLLVSGLPRSLPSLPRPPAPLCLPCVEGRQRAAPHSSEFPPTTAPLQTLHMDVWGPAPDGGTEQERYFLLQNGIAERRIGLIMEVARTSMIHAAAPHFLWPFAVRYAAHQLNLWPRVSEPETSPTLRWTGKVGDASVFRVLGALSLVRDAKASKLSSRTLRCVFLGFPTDAPPWQFYHPRSRRVFSSQDITFDESVCYYRLHPHASHPGPAPLRVLQVDPPPLVEPLEISSDSSSPVEGGDPAADDTVATRRSPRLETPPGFPPRPSSPPPQPAVVDSGAETAGAEPGGAETEGEGSGGISPGGAATGGAGSGGAATKGAGSWGAATGGANSGGPASPNGGGAVGDPPRGPRAGQPPQPDLLETLSPQAIRAWIVRRGSPGGGGYGPVGGGAASPGGTTSAGGTGGTAGGAGGAAGAGGTRGAAGAGGTRGAAGAGGAGATSPRGATGAGGVGPTSLGGTASAGGAGGAAGAGGAGPGGTRGAAAAGPGGAGTGGAGGAGASGAVRAGGASGAVGSGGTGGTAGARGAGAAGAGCTAGAGGAGGAIGATSTGGAGGTAGAGGAGAGGTGGTGGIRAAGPGGARTRGAGAAGAGGDAGAGGAGDATGATGTGGAGGTTRARGPGAAGARGAAGAGGAGGATGAAGAGGAGAAGAGGAGAADQSQPQLLPGSPLSAPAPHTEVIESLTERREPETRASTPVRARCCVVLPEPPASSLPHIPDPESDLVRVASPTVTRLLATFVTDPDLESTAAFALVTELVDFAARSRLDYVASLVTDLSLSVLQPLYLVSHPCYFALRETRMHLTSLPPSSVPQRVVLPEPPASSLPHVPDPESDLARVASPTITRLLATFVTDPDLESTAAFALVTELVDFAARSRLDYVASLVTESESVCPPSVGGEIAFGSNVLEDRQFELKCLAAALPRFASMLLCPEGDPDALDIPTPRSYAEAIAGEYSSQWQTAMDAEMASWKSTGTYVDQSLEPSGPYPELVGCLMYLMTCRRPDLAYPRSLLARYVAPGRHQKVHWDAAKRALRYLCCTSGMGLVLGGQGLVVLIGHSDASWADDQANQRLSQGYTFSLGSGSVSWRSSRSSSVLGSSCEVEIYARAMAAQELCWLTYLLTDLGERPRSTPVLYVDNNAMLALCHEKRLEHRTKHIAHRYFLARELQRRRQLRLSYVASRAKALGSGDHQHFCTALGLVPTLPHLLVA